MAAVLKIENSQYLAHGLTEHHEIWRGDAHWPSSQEHVHVMFRQRYWPSAPNRLLEFRTLTLTRNQSYWTPLTPALTHPLLLLHSLN